MCLTSLFWLAVRMYVRRETKKILKKYNITRDKLCYYQLQIAFDHFVRRSFFLCRIDSNWCRSSSVFETCRAPCWCLLGFARMTMDRGRESWESRTDSSQSTISLRLILSWLYVSIFIIPMYIYLSRTFKSLS